MPNHPLIARLRARLDPSGPEPLARQIVEHVWAEVVEGRLPTGERLPTVRRLAIELGLSPRSVERAYGELEKLGITVTRPGEGTFVSLSPPPEEERRRHRTFVELCRRTVAAAHELGYGVDELLDEIREYPDPPQPEGVDP
jgi:GntR family transcriptional regulator